MKRHRSGLRSVSSICVMSNLGVKIVTSNCDGLNTGCDTDRRRCQRLSLLSVSLTSIETRSVSSWQANCDTDRSFALGMTRPCVSHSHLSLLIQNTPLEFLSSNPMLWNTSSTRHQPIQVELVKRQHKNQNTSLPFYNIIAIPAAFIIYIALCKHHIICSTINY